MTMAGIPNSAPTVENRLVRWWKQYLQCFRENRASERRPSCIPAEISWSGESGSQVISRGVCIDLSAGGLGVVYPGPMPGQEHIHVKLESDRVVKCARVRHCQQNGGSYLLGVEFAPGCCRIPQTQ